MILIGIENFSACFRGFRSSKILRTFPNLTEIRTRFGGNLSGCPLPYTKLPIGRKLGRLFATGKISPRDPREFRRSISMDPRIFPYHIGRAPLEARCRGERAMFPRKFCTTPMYLHSCIFQGAFAIKWHFRWRFRRYPTRPVVDLRCDRLGPTSRRCSPAMVVDRIQVGCPRAPRLRLRLLPKGRG